MKRIFILEDSPARIDIFAAALVRPGIDLTVAEDVDSAIKAFEPPYDLLLLDHDLGGEAFMDSGEYNTGYTFAKYLTAMNWPEPPQIVIHSWNPDGAATMAGELVEYFNMVSRIPFGARLLEVLQRF